MQTLVRRVPVAGYVIRYALKLARLTRPLHAERRTTRPEHSRLRQEIRHLGSRPAGQAESDPGCQSEALLRGRTYVAAEDVRAHGPPGHAPTESLPTTTPKLIEWPRMRLSVGCSRWFPAMASGAVDALTRSRNPGPDRPA